MGTPKPAPARVRSNVQTVSAVTYPSLHTLITSCVTALSAQHVVAFAARGRAHEHPRQTPESPQKRRPDEVRRIDEEHGTSAGAGLLEGWLELLFEETGLLLGVLFD